MNGRHLMAGVALMAGSLVCGAGCALLATPESQLFTRSNRCQSASINYYVVPPAGDLGRPCTLAIVYPHPSARSGYARVELLVESGLRAGESARKLPAWLDRARRFANDNLPGMTLGDGIESALGLDIRMDELDPLIDRLEQPSDRSQPSQWAGQVLVIATIDGRALDRRASRVRELDALVARVRREGRVVSHKSQARSIPLDPLSREVTIGERGAVVQAGYREGPISRLPPVEPICPAMGDDTTGLKAGAGLVTPAVR